MSKIKEREQVYICSHIQNSKDYWVLQMPNGMNVARVTTHLIEKLFPGTDWRAETVNSLDYLDGVVKWMFASVDDYYEYFSWN